MTPGIPYYYKFTVVKSDMTESAFSNVAQGTPLDTIPPMLAHTPVTTAAPGLALTLAADATDNVAVQAVTLYFRAIGETVYTARAMTHTTGNRYSATIEGSRITSPGIEYTIEATDGISTVRSGRPEYPHQVVVTDKPTLTAVTPNRGPADGGTAATIAGSNFKPGATVTFGGAAADSVTVVSSSQITCTTPAYYPTAVDVVVTNPGGATGTLTRGFTFESTTASLSLPATGGEQHATAQIPINAANVQGLAAADIRVTFDSAVLSARGAVYGQSHPRLEPGPEHRHGRRDPPGTGQSGRHGDRGRHAGAAGVRGGGRSGQQLAADVGERSAQRRRDPGRPCQRCLRGGERL